MPSSKHKIRVTLYIRIAVWCNGKCTHRFTPAVSRQWVVAIQHSWHQSAVHHQSWTQIDLLSREGGLQHIDFHRGHQQATGGVRQPLGYPGTIPDNLSMQKPSIGAQTVLQLQLVFLPRQALCNTWHPTHHPSPPASPCQQPSRPGFWKVVCLLVHAAAGAPGFVPSSTCTAAPAQQSVSVLVLSTLNASSHHFM